MNKKISLVLGIFLIFGFSLIIVNAANSSDLQKAYDNAKCKSDFTIGVVNSLVNVQNSVPLTDSLSKLNSDLTQLQSLSVSSDTTTFKDFLKNNFDADLNAAVKNVNDWRLQNKGNLSSSDKSSLNSTYFQLKSVYDNCQISSLNDYGSERLNSFNNTLEDYQNNIDKLNSSGVDVNELNQIISDAQTQILMPLQNALSSINETNSSNKVFSQYCLFDGCDNGTNFHLDAKISIANLDISLNRINNLSNSSSVSSQITQLQTDISNAKNALSIVGAQKYTQDQEKNIFNSIKDADQSIKQIAMQIVQMNRLTRQENIVNRTNNFTRPGMINRTIDRNFTRPNWNSTRNLTRQMPQRPPMPRAIPMQRRQGP